jgi:pyridoxine 5-phosphate synthase
VKSVNPSQVTLVPDPPEALTSNAGWNTVAHFSFLKDIINELKECGIRTSIFIDTTPEFIIKAAETDVDRVELYTEPYATQFPENKEKAIAPFVEAATLAKNTGLQINAGHDLNLLNLKYFSENIPFLKEVSIGHALIADALYFGLEKTVKLYKECLI